MRSEFQFIQHIKKKYSLGKIGDDCAVLPHNERFDMVVTADLLVEDIDFRREWIAPEFLGHRSLAVSLSDIAAMGATPKWALLSLGIPENIWDSGFLDHFFDGWHELSKIHGVELVGGDISKAPDKFVIDSTVIGEVPTGKAIFRNGARIGDAVIVTNSIGGSAGGLEILKKGIVPDDELQAWQADMIVSHLRPIPRVEIGKFLQTRSLANSMIDISDGLTSDLGQICKASNVGAKLFTEKIPIDGNLDRLLGSFEERLLVALNGGEDYELLFTADNEKWNEFLDSNSGKSESDVFHVIGEITPHVGTLEIVTDGIATTLEPHGFQHF